MGQIFSSRVNTALFVVIVLVSSSIIVLPVSSVSEVEDELFEQKEQQIVDFDFKNYSKFVVRKSGPMTDVVVYYEAHSEYPDVVNQSDFYPSCCNITGGNSRYSFEARFGNDSDRMKDPNEWSRILLFRFDQGQYLNHFLLMETAYELPMVTLFENNIVGGAIILVMENGSKLFTSPSIHRLEKFATVVHMPHPINQFHQIVYAYNNLTLDSGTISNDVFLSKDLILSSSHHYLSTKEYNWFLGEGYSGVSLVVGRIYSNNDFSMQIEFEMAWRTAALPRTFIDIESKMDTCTGFLIDLKNLDSICNRKGKYRFQFDFWGHACLDFMENNLRMFCQSFNKSLPMYYDDEIRDMVYFNWTDEGYFNHSNRVGIYDRNTGEFTEIGKEGGMIYQFELVGDVVVIEVGGPNLDYHQESSQLSTFKENSTGNWTRTNYVDLDYEILIGWARTPAGFLAIHTRNINDISKSTLKIVDLESGNIPIENLTNIDLVTIDGVLLRSTKWIKKGNTNLNTLIYSPIDSDKDGIPDRSDPCPENPNGDEELKDFDEDQIPDLCDEDDDNDSVLDIDDGCQYDYFDWTSNQTTDYDSDGCFDNLYDLDDDQDGILDAYDECPKSIFGENISRVDLDGDGCIDFEDLDWDGDGILNQDDPCPINLDLYLDESLLDFDNDGCSDSTDPDDDNDGIIDEEDDCPFSDNSNPESIDSFDLDKDGCTYSEDPDIDGDGILNQDDKCPTSPINDKVNVSAKGCPEQVELEIDDISIGAEIPKDYSIISSALVTFLTLILIITLRKKPV